MRYDIVRFLDVEIKAWLGPVLAEMSEEQYEAFRDEWHRIMKDIPEDERNEALIGFLSGVMGDDRAEWTA